MDQKLSQLVEDLTTSGDPQLNPEKMKELKKICKSSDELISHAYHLLMTQLNQEHAEIRFSAFQILDELFIRSHQFRTLIISNFQEFLELTIETDHEQPLPPPKEVAQKLKKTAMKSVQAWHEKYGEAYKKLSLGYHFLKQNKKVDFQDVNVRTLAERRREEEKQKRLDNIYKERAKRAEKEMEEMSQEIQDTLTEMENCFRLLMPDPFDFTVNDAELDPVTERTANEDKPTSSLSMQIPDLQPYLLGHMDDEQPCCSRDLPSVSPCLIVGRNRDLNEELGLPEQKEIGRGECSEAQIIAAASNDDDYETFVRNHGLGSHKYTLNLEISTDVKVRENEDNTAIINNIIDAHKLIRNKFLPSVQSWIQLFTRAGINDDCLRCAIDFKNKLETAMEKHKEMNIDYKERKRKVMKVSDNEDDEDEDEFVEVPEKEGYEPHIPDHLRKEYGLEPQSSPKALARGMVVRPALLSSHSQSERNEEELDPTCAAATLKLIRDKLPKLPSLNTSASSNPEPAASEELVSETGKLEEERAKAPIIPFGLDLYYWGQDQPTACKILKFSSQHRFWAPNEMEEEVENKEVAEMLKSRCITFSGKFEPVKHKCRAPMPDGRLCERQDRVKCPFHGKIIPRDDSGNPINPEDKMREEKKRFEKRAEKPEWQDPEFMREVEAATGVDLGSSRYSGKGKGGKNKGKKRKYPNLTDLKQEANTSRSRLEKKVFNKGSMKRVVKAMNRMDQKKHEKFANQFNYALN
ncbi:UV-stimulated scaffold protein A isoform X1 [Chelonoidis abingdonii]|uniref:UV-stimulated scaffold protein A isoform X1 n=2 Tax=Chelonoidis abingdonii TaxID=106734 RepID=UPI0013F2222E|nr:UV-stimulated scaffold protein A isoform X1 [Chelonoidis abingdonii]